MAYLGSWWLANWFPERPTLSISCEIPPPHATTHATKFCLYHSLCSVGIYVSVMFSVASFHTLPCSLSVLFAVILFVYWFLGALYIISSLGFFFHYFEKIFFLFCACLLVLCIFKFDVKNIIRTYFLSSSYFSFVFKCMETRTSFSLCDFISHCLVQSVEQREGQDSH